MVGFFSGNKLTMIKPFGITEQGFYGKYSFL